MLTMMTMAFYKIILFVFVNILILCDIPAAFNVEELKLVNYEVDIQVSPVQKGENSQSVVHITSKSGQKFQCSLPQLNEDDISEKEVINERDDDVLQLLKPMKTGPCLTKGKDWWTYEFCFGHYIKQYHVEDGHIIGPVLTLGLYESDFDWNNETSQEKFKLTKQKYHSQYYANGTKCDLTGMPRNAEVRIYCEEDAGDYIYRVDEPGTCSYIITVHTSRLCSHPQLKPLPIKKAHTISCNPLLNDAQYSIYLQKLKEEKAVAEEKRNLWLFNQQERLQVMKNENEAAEENTLFEKTQTVNHQSNNEDFIQKMLLQEYDKQIEKLKKSLPPEKFASVKNDIQKRLDKILEQVGKDFDSEFNKEAKDSSFSKMKIVFNTLFEKLGKAEQDVARATEELQKAKSAISDVHVSDSDGEEPEPNSKRKKENVETENIEEIGKAINSGEHAQSQVLDDDKLQVRIRRLDRKSSDSKLNEMDFEQRKKLEQAVKEKLEKAGLNIGGRKIEVKIITAGYYDNEDGKDFQTLTDEETDQFQNMIMALLTGQQEAVEEMKRHKKLEESYEYIWNEVEESDKKEN